ncbi:condensin-2 complex subunit G2 [Skeletonema marinoi]|uniref:Condensin-2 complex subunit G2 n=1 Tax=Skeletonema marinoi TaxID=267567 RepID=A0AAD8YIW4_9STRA|nr:condensin-2 complex subunit G2 [Skeletonema marinoi]
MAAEADDTTIMEAPPPADGDADISFAEREEDDDTLDHSDLFAAVEESVISCRPLVNFFYHPTDNDDTTTKLTTRQRRDVICNIVKSPKFNKTRARRLFSGLTPLLRKVVDEESYCPDQDDNGEIIVDAHAASTLAVMYLRICAFLVDAYLDGLLKRQRKGANNNNKRVEVIDEVFEVAEMLHDLLFPLQNCGKEGMATQSAIFAMCENWWHGNFDEKELFVTQLIPLLLVKSLEDTAQKNDVKRLYSIRDAIDLLDFECESITTLKNHLLRTVANPLFLQSTEGKKFITHLFHVDASLVGELHKAIKVQLFEAKRSILNAYGEIYYNAWKQSADKKEDEDEEEGQGEIQASIEENALQDMMYYQIHAANPKIASSIRIVLDKFYVNKKSPDVESMLHRCYGPLLWRSLAATNARVRLQAAAVLTDTFPLRDPDAGQEWTEACVQKSVEALISLMSDEVAAVRVAGSNATAKILSQFWVAIPANDIRKLLNHIIAKHASDLTSSAVRATAIKTVTTLLEEDKTHAVLRSLLPSLGNLIHDKSEKVRLAVVEMLLFVKKLRGMKYYHIVDPQNLLGRLADEGRGRSNPTGPVAIGLSELLSNSFFPVGKNKTMSDIINRTLRLLTDNPDAAVTFYRNAGTQLGVNSISKLIAALMRCLCMLIVQDKKMNCEDISNLSIVMADDEIDSAKVPPNTALMATIAESISILWGSIEADLKHEQNESAADILMEVFSGNVLTEVYSHFESKTVDGLEDAKMAECSRACVAILNCAGKMKETEIEGLRAHVIGELAKATDMPPEKRTRVNFSPNMALLCEWGMTEDVAQCLSNSVLNYFSPDNLDGKPKTSKKRKQRGKKTAAKDELPQLDIETSLGILGNILKGSYPASLSARDSIIKSEAAFTAISTALQSARTAAETIIKSQLADESEVSIAKIRHIGNAIECYGRLLVHREAMRGEVPMRLSQEAKELLSWVTDNIIPSMMKSVEAEEENSLSKLDISAISGIGSPMACDDPPRRKSNRRSARESDVSFLSSDQPTLNTLQEPSKHISSISAVSIASASSVLSTFAEWLSICGAESFLLIHISKWCEVLGATDNTKTRESLLGSLFHVALRSLKDDRDVTVFKELLLHLKDVDPSTKEKEIIIESLSIITSLRDEQIATQALATIIYVTRSIIVQAVDNDNATFLDMVGPGMKEVLLGILNNKRSSLLLAKCLLNEPKVSSIRESLVKEIRANSPMSDALEAIVRELSGENIVTDGETEEEIGAEEEPSIILEQAEAAETSELHSQPKAVALES